MSCFRVYIYIVLCLISVRTDDYFDPGVMDRLQQQLNLISETTQLDLNGSNSSVTFHSSVSTHQSHHSNLPNICTLKLPCRNYHLSNPSHKWFAWRTSGLHEGQVVCMEDKWFAWRTSGLHEGQVVYMKDTWFTWRTSENVKTYNAYSLVLILPKISRMHIDFDYSRSLTNNSPICFKTQWFQPPPSPVILILWRSQTTTVELFGIITDYDKNKNTALQWIFKALQINIHLLIKYAHIYTKTTHFQVIRAQFHNNLIWLKFNPKYIRQNNTYFRQIYQEAEYIGYLCI